MENLNPPLNLVFSTRAASQEITVPSDATKRPLPFTHIEIL